MTEWGVGEESTTASPPDSEPRLIGGSPQVKHAHDVHSEIFQAPFPTLDAVVCKHSVNASTGTCDVIEYLFMLGLAQKDFYGCSEVPGTLATWQ